VFFPMQHYDVGAMSNYNFTFLWGWMAQTLIGHAHAAFLPCGHLKFIATWSQKMQRQIGEMLLPKCQYLVLGDDDNEYI